jgi:hypothetical protein
MSARIETAIDKIDEIQQKFDDELDLLKATLHHQQVMLNNILEHVKVYVEAVEADRKRVSQQNLDPLFDKAYVEAVEADRKRAK